VKKYVIVVAGGSGRRMGGETPKQFLFLGKMPVLMHTLNCFSSVELDVSIILVLPEQFTGLWQDLCTRCHFDVPHQLVTGGEQRGDSVRNGLAVIHDVNALVAVHDGVRPFVSRETIDKAFNLARHHFTAVPAREITDSVRISENGFNRPFDRKQLRTIQTPQCFRLDILRKAYASANSGSYTDDASLVGSLGYNIQLFEGNPENIKITTPFDLLLANALLQQNTDPRVELNE